MRVDKIENLALYGATVGEREAAKAALGRIAAKAARRQRIARKFATRPAVRVGRLDTYA